MGLKSIPLLAYAQCEMTGPVVPITHQYRYCTVQGLKGADIVIVIGFGLEQVELLFAESDGRYEIDLDGVHYAQARHEGSASEGLSVFFEE